MCFIFSDALDNLFQRYILLLNFHCSLIGALIITTITSILISSPFSFPSSAFFTYHLLPPKHIISSAGVKTLLLLL